MAQWRRTGGGGGRGVKEPQQAHRVDSCIIALMACANSRYILYFVLEGNNCYHLVHST